MGLGFPHLICGMFRNTEKSFSKFLKACLEIVLASGIDINPSSQWMYLFSA